MRHFSMARRAGVPAVAAVIGALVAGPAFADATVSPTTAVQGSGENLTFHITNTGTAALATVTLNLPADDAVAELYPLSVDDWAPKIHMKKLATPLATIHGGTPATESADAVTWLAMPGKQLAPGAATDLSIAIGPLPTLSSMQFTLTTTYADGQPGPTMPAQVALTPAAAGQVATHDHAGTATDATGDTSSDAEDALFAQTVADGSRGTSIWSIGGWVAAALMLLGGVIYILRNRHRADEDDDPDEEDDAVTPEDKPAEAKEEVSAGSKWSLRS
ncbi:DUF1775 domain-containing protein [Actinoplanes sp. NPDC026619]|uniref:DUF1775 domain-containing protein n=1 Tax=Actinoplanes sp. NPDC026619 TaxID=3155798 RepID=UPI0033F4D575